MFENRSGESCLVSRAPGSSCQPETKWTAYMRSFIASTKRQLELDESHDCRQNKASKLSDSSASSEDSVEQAYGDDNQLMDSDGGSPDSVEQSDAERGDDGLPYLLLQDSSEHSEGIESESDDSSQSKYPELMDSAENLRERREHYQDDGDELLGSDGSLPDSHEQPGYGSGVDDNKIPDSPREPNKPLDDGGSQRQGGDSSSDLDSLIQPIGRDNSISCLLKCSRSDYGSIASLNRSFRNLIRSGEIYKLRRKNGVIEHWVYFSCNLLQWEAFDPIGHRWMRLPQMPHNECFIYSDKESLAVGTDLLVFGIAQVIYRYSLLTNSWSTGPRMNVPRCLFGSASLGEIAILAGGCDSQGNILRSAEMYNSETQEWETLPPMKKPRKMCSGVFMDGKFYVIGGNGGNDLGVLTCGEEYDLERKTWTEIPNMSPGEARDADMPSAAGAPPLVAVVNNELYAADYAGMELKKYNKERRSWFTVGSLPDRAASMNGWGLAFRACGDRLIVIGGPRTTAGGFIELNSWVPSEGPPQWILLERKEIGNFVYNCAVMGC